MNDQIDQRMRQLIHELSDNAPRPNDWEEIPAVRPELPPGRPVWLFVAAAAMFVVGVVTVGFAVSRAPSTVSPNVIDTAPESPAASPSSAPTGSTTTNATSTSSAPTSLSTTPRGSVVTPINVSYQAPPAPLDPVTFASVQLSEGSGEPDAAASSVAALDEGRAVVVDTMARTLIVVESTGAQRDVPLPLEHLPFIVTGGPGDVIYGIVSAPTTDLSRGAIVAIPVTGDRAGTVVASAALSINPYVESARTVLGHGPTGIIDRRTGEELLAYVDIDGNPIGLDQDAPHYTLEADDTIRDEGGTTRWALGIERHPDYVGGYISDPPPASLGTSEAMYATALGPPLDPVLDHSDPSLPVVALLGAGGTGTWYSLTDGWAVAASDLFGLILARTVDGAVELARPPSTSVTACQAVPPFTPTTLPPGFASEILLGEGGQITIGPDGEAVPIEPVNPDVYHYAGEPGRFIDVHQGTLPGHSSVTIEPIEVLDGTGQFSEIEDGYKVEFSIACGRFTLIASGISSSDFKSVIEGLVPTS